MEIIVGFWVGVEEDLGFGFGYVEFEIYVSFIIRWREVGGWGFGWEKIEFRDTKYFV